MLASHAINKNRAKTVDLSTQGAGKGSSLAGFCFSLNNFPFLFKMVSIQQPRRLGSALEGEVVRHGAED